MSEAELIQAISSKPGIYLGKKTISGLSHFLDGYALAMSSIGASYDRTLTEDFQKFIATKFHIASSQKWDQIILFFEQDECKAFDRATELFREYLNLHNLGE